MMEDRDDGLSENSRIEDTTIFQTGEREGSIIGPYKLLEVIGEGGMGVVFKAEQATPVKRLVALKIIKPGMDTKQVVARFEIERQALAMMDHPNIAKVLDAGTTRSGRPYFVMELVNGQPATTFCDERQLTTRKRLELFIPICQAVQHAHLKGIIHRDLKPSNILVTLYDGQPVPKIIDFGVAKATSEVLTENTLFTRFGQFLGTLGYMSPEQAGRSQKDIDTRTDIYSLGVVLYELLTGETPFDRKRLRSAGYEEILRIIRNEEPSKPSVKVGSSQSLPSIAANRSTEPGKLHTLFQGELDWIVLKAMDKDRKRRYLSATRLAEDVQHYLNHEPVLASPPSRLYVFRKLVRRNRALIAVWATIVSTIALAILVLIWQRFESQRQLDTQKAERLLEQLLDGPPESVPFVVEAIEPNRDLMASRLDSIFQAVDGTTESRLRAALGKASFGDVEQAFILESVASAKDAECSNILDALNHAAKFDHSAMASLANEARQVENWQTRSRYAIIALYSGDPSIAQEACNANLDPVQRTSYITTIPRWHGDIGAIKSFIHNATDPMLRHSTVLGVGSIPLDQFSENEKRQWSQLLNDWFINQPDPATHSATSWVLSKWKLELPASKMGVDVSDPKDWYLNKNSMTMLKVPAGSFRRTNLSSGEMTNRQEKRISQTVTLSRAFFLSDREVTAGQFRAFIADPTYPDALKPDRWLGVELGISPTDEHPVQMVNWMDAVLYCNWLSSSEGLMPCYVLQTHEKQKPATWKVNHAADGYRLPTEAEWEYAARAGADTLFCHGSDSTTLQQWAVLGGRLNAAPTATTMPNAWGFFDMHGNVWEWCSDWFEEYPAKNALTDPMGPLRGKGRVIRGGSFARGPYQSSAQHRYVSIGPAKRDSGIGFRVARNSAQ